MASSGTMTVGLKLLYDREGEKISFPIEEGETFIGRKDYCDICFPDGSVSKRHVKIVRGGSKVELFDAGSRNGTLVNGKVVEHVPLRDGDVIQLGKIVLTVAGPDAGAGLREESRDSRASRDSFKDFDDFDAETDENDSPKDAPRSKGGKAKPDRSEKAGKDAPPASTKRMDAKELAAKAASGSQPPASGEVVGTPVASASASSELPPKAKFTIVGGDGKGKVFELSPDKPFTLGTKEENNIPLKGDGISRYHAEVLLENGAWVLKDLGSRNGSFVGDRKVDLHELAPGDVVMIGTVYLRFEQESKGGGVAGSSPLDQVKELVELLKKDPKAFVQSQNGRRAMMIVLGVLIAFVLLAPGGGAVQQAGPVQHGSDDAVTHQLIDLIQKDQALKARDVIARTRNSFKAGQDRPILTLVDEVAKIWVDRAAPLTFEWKGAITAIDKLSREGRGDLDKDCLDWLSKTQKELEEELPNHKIIFQGQAQLTAAQTAVRRGDVKESLAQFKAAHDILKTIPKKSAFVSSATTFSERARSALVKGLQKEADRLIKIDPTPWQDAIDRLNDAIEYSATSEEKAPLRKLVEECQANQRDEEAFAKAVDIVQKRDTLRYDEAIQLLSGIAKSSHVYVDAQTYLHWIQADRDVRNAKTAYDEGNWEKALGLLNNALRVAELGPEARQSVDRRKELWQKVHVALQEGLQLSAKGDDVNAITRLEEVLKLEQNAKNRYHILAEGEINVIRERGDKWIDGKLAEGLEYLEKGRWKDAYDRFKFVFDHAKNDKVRLNKIESAVAQTNNKKHLYQDCYKRWVTNQNAMFEPSFLETLRLLGRWLPATSEDKPKAIELFKKVKERLRVAMDQHKDDDEK